MDVPAMPSVPVPLQPVSNFTGYTIFTAMQINSSRLASLTVLPPTTQRSPVTGAGGGSLQVNKVVAVDSGEEDDSFGEHYFHICIYIWACVVISSLIALSVKWGCCGRSLTRWEVKRIPLKRFQRVDGEDCQDKCPICHEEFHEERLIRQLPCNHCYHSYCVDRWLVKMSNRCPLCKQRVSISLLCPWTKQRRRKEMNEHLATDLEASVDDSPPLPPLSTLTPNCWYGEEIMSGPSRFIIMRPGVPTRVIDLREQKKSSPPTNILEAADTFLSESNHTINHESQNFIEVEAQESCAGSDSYNVSNSCSTSEHLASIKTLFEGSAVLVPSARTSRSGSVCSDQPLLLQGHQCCGIESNSNISHSDNTGSDITGSDITGSNITGSNITDCSGSCQCSPSDPLAAPFIPSPACFQCGAPGIKCSVPRRLTDAKKSKVKHKIPVLSSSADNLSPILKNTEGVNLGVTNPSHLVDNPAPGKIYTSLRSKRAHWRSDCSTAIPLLSHKQRTLPDNATQVWIFRNFAPSHSDTSIQRHLRSSIISKEQIK